MWVRDITGGAELLVLVQPRASRTRVVGEHDGRLKLAIAAPPVDGMANAALVDFLAERLGVPRRSVFVVDGDTSRRKRIRVDGVTAASIREMIAGSP